MPYSYKNSKGQTYYLHGKKVTLQGGRKQKIHFFAREPKPGEALDSSPRGPRGGGERAHRPALPQAGQGRPPSRPPKANPPPGPRTGGREERSQLRAPPPAAPSDVLLGPAQAHRRSGSTEGQDSRLVYSTDGGPVERSPPATPRRAGSRGRGSPCRPRGAPGPGRRLGAPVAGQGRPGGEDGHGRHRRARPRGDLESLAVELRRAVGAGGGVREGAIEIQGDHRERLAQRLTALGYRVKLAGG